MSAAALSHVRRLSLALATVWRFAAVMIGGMQKVLAAALALGGLGLAGLGAPPAFAAGARAAGHAPAAVKAAYASCGDAPSFAAVALRNGASIDTLDWKPFGLPEKGWALYEIIITREVGTSCGAGTAVFARELAAFQQRYNLPATGVFDLPTFEVMKGLWQERRPFVMMRVQHLCPDAPAPQMLIGVPKDQETFEREGRSLRLDALLAYEKMLAAARAESGALRQDPKALTIFSGYRSPESDAVRCQNEKNCDGARRAACSAHRTGTALDLNVGWVQGVAADTTTNENRMMQTRTAAYKWLVANAGRFGFVNYPFEPWHWEYVGPLTAMGQTPVPLPAGAASGPHRPSPLTAAPGDSPSQTPATEPGAPVSPHR